MSVLLDKMPRERRSSHRWATTKRSAPSTGARKIVPQEHREAQSTYFGKKGITSTDAAHTEFETRSAGENITKKFNAEYIKEDIEYMGGMKNTKVAAAKTTPDIGVYFSMPKDLHSLSIFSSPFG